MFVPQYTREQAAKLRPLSRAPPRNSPAFSSRIIHESRNQCVARGAGSGPGTHHALTTGLPSSAGPETEVKLVLLGCYEEGQAYDLDTVRAALADCLEDVSFDVWYPGGPLGLKGAVGLTFKSYEDAAPLILGHFDLSALSEYAYTRTYYIRGLTNVHYEIAHRVAIESQLFEGLDSEQTFAVLTTLPAHLPELAVHLEPVKIYKNDVNSPRVEIVCLNIASPTHLLRAESATFQWYGEDTTVYFKESAVGQRVPSECIVLVAAPVGATAADVLDTIQRLATHLQLKLHADHKVKQVADVRVTGMLLFAAAFEDKQHVAKLLKAIAAAAADFARTGKRSPALELFICGTSLVSLLLGKAHPAGRTDALVDKQGGLIPATDARCAALAAIAIETNTPYADLLEPRGLRAATKDDFARAKEAAKAQQERKRTNWASRRDDDTKRNRAGGPGPSDQDAMQI